MFNTFKKLLLKLPVQIAAGLAAFYLLFAYFAVDPLAKRLLPWVAEHQLASRASVGQVKFDPLRLTLTVDNLNLTQASGAPLASVEHLFADLESDGLLHLTWHIKDIQLTAPKALVEIAPDGKLNWSDLIAKLNEDKDPSSPLPRLKIDHIRIEQGNVQYAERNRPEPFKAALAPLGLELDGLSTLPEDRGDYLLVARLPEQGGTLKWKGDIGVNPVASKGSMEIAGIKLAQLMKLAPPLPLQLNAGEIASSFNYQFALQKNGETFTPVVAAQNLALNLAGIQGTLSGIKDSQLGLQQASISLPKLDFSMRNGTQLTLQGMQAGFKDASLQLDKNTLLKLPQTQVNNVGFDLTANKLKTGDITLTGTTLQLPGAALFKLAQAQVGSVDFDLGANKLATGDISLTGANLQQAGAPMFKLARAQVGGVDVDLAANVLKVGEVSLADGAVQAKRLANGNLDWLSLLPASDTAKPQTPGESSKPLTFDIAGIHLKHWQVGLQDLTFKQPLSLDVQNMDVGFALSNTDGGIALRKLNHQMGPVTLTSAGAKQPVATLAKLNLQDGDISTKTSTFKAKAFTLSGLKTEVLHQPGKPINWQTLLEPAAPTSAPTPAVGKKTASPEWKLALGRIALDNAAVHVEDSSAGSPVAMDIEQAAFELKDASLDLAKPLPVSARFKVKQGGEFDASGKLALAPLKGNLQLKLHELSLKPFAPFINQAALLTLENGTASVAGKLALHSSSALSGQFQGGFSVNNLAINEEKGGAPFLGWNALASDGLKIGLNPNLIHMDELRITQPSGKVIIYEDKSINIKRILRAQAAAPSPAPNAEPSQPAWPVTVERVKIDAANLEFADLSLRPQFGTHINSLSGVINGLSTSPDSTAQVELDGKVDEYGSARIRGSIKPFRATDFTDLKLAFRNLEMNRLTPYSGKFAGRKIDSGKMSIDLGYNIKKRQLAGENKFVINSLKLGERVESADAVNLPLDLAITLLEDSDGVIDLDLPVSGNLDDPQFSYGKVVWKAFVNIMGKIVTAPFRALGKLFGANSDKLEAIAFDPGSAELAPPEKEKLKTLAQGLAKRPALTLTIVPAYDAAADSKAFQETTVRRQVLQEMGLKVQANEKPGPIDLSNPKAQAAILKLTKENSPEAKNRKWYDKVKDYLDTTKPPTDPAAYQAMVQQLQQQITIPEGELKALADARATAMQQHIEQIAGNGVVHISKATPEPSAGSGKEVLLKMKLGTGK